MRKILDSTKFDWKIHEKECLLYLQKKYSRVTFELKGGSNSTESDIFVNSRIGKFYIDAKMPNSQCGQFVLLPDLEKEKFYFSKRNKSLENIFTSAIIRILNSDFNRFCNAGTTGEKIDEYYKGLFKNWIVNYYRNKNVKFIITKYQNDFLIFPIDKLDVYFDIEAYFREKKSGSNTVSKKNYQLVKDSFHKYGINLTIKNKNLVCDEMISEDVRQQIAGNVYYIRKGGKEVRRLSNTRNGNVIFSISLKIYTQDCDDLKSFEKEIGYM